MLIVLLPLLSVANNTSFFSAVSNDTKSSSPYSITESIRTNLYLLQPDNSIVLADGVYMEYNNLYHDSVTLEDAGKMTNFLENLGLLRYAKTLAVERRPIIVANDTLFYKLWQTTKRNYQFQLTTKLLTNPDLQAFFIDSYLNTSTLLPLGGLTKINFTVNADVASGATDRFKIIFKSKKIDFSPLPVTFTSVKAYRQNNCIAIDWKVENEINMAKYEVEKSLNGKDYAVVNMVAVNGLNNIAGNYLWIDKTQVAGDIFYRIKSFGVSGSIKYTPVMSIKHVQSTASITVYPNPVQGNTINLQMANQTTGMYQLKLINNAGQIVYSNKIGINSSSMSQSLHVGDNVLKGMYQLEVKNADNVATVKTVLLQ